MNTPDPTLTRTYALPIGGMTPGEEEDIRAALLDLTRAPGESTSNRTAFFLAHNLLKEVDALREKLANQTLMHSLTPADDPLQPRWVKPAEMPPPRVIVMNVAFTTADDPDVMSETLAYWSAGTWFSGVPGMYHQPLDSYTTVHYWLYYPTIKRVPPRPIAP